jgi:hypothetical protein
MLAHFAIPVIIHAYTLTKNTQMATKAMQIVRKLAGPPPTIFNDKLKGGGRSIKVWRWQEEDYAPIKAALEAA